MPKMPAALPVPTEAKFYLKGESLVVVAPAGVIESCLAVPAVRALKAFRPMSKFTVLCDADSAVLWPALGFDVLSYPVGSSARKIASLCKGKDFDSAVIWQACEAAKALKKLNVEQRVGYPAKGLEACLTQAISVPSAPGPIEHRVRFYLKLVDQLGAPAFVAANFITLDKRQPSGPLTICLSPRSNLGASHEWVGPGWLKVVQSFEKHWGQPVRWLLIGEDYPELEQAFADAGVEIAERVAADPGSQLNAMVRSHAVLTVDSDTPHLAAYLGVPAVVLFGPNEPAWKRPLGKQHRVVREHVCCSPCFAAKCVLDLRCMHRIKPSAVLAQLTSVVSELVLS